MTDTVFMKQNDRRPYLQIAFTDSAGAAVDLTSAQAVYFSMRNKASGTVKVNRQAAVVTSATGGLVEYRWASGDTDTVGVYQAEFEIEWSTGVYETQPEDGYIMLEIVDDIA
jgi:hypothetical protein